MSTSKRLTRLAALLLAGSVLGACATLDGDTAIKADVPPTAEQSHAQAIAELKARPIPDEPMSRAAYWAQRTELEPKDVETSVQFAKSLRGIGSNARAVEFLEERLAVQPDEAHLIAEYGKSLIAVGRLDKALPVLTQAQQMLPDDWTILVAIGVIYDQTGDFASARRSYEMALAISPNNPSILNNLGLSYLMAGDKANASKYLLAAASAPGADARVRANLALVANTGPATAATNEPQPKAQPSNAAPTPKAEPTAEAAPDEPRTMATDAGGAGLRGTN